MNIALTIAGSDSGGGAGIQADLKTFHQFGVFGTSVVAAVTAQNTLGVTAVHVIPVDIIEKQMAALATDLPPEATKTGMLGTADVVKAVADGIDRYGFANYVLDPVMVATSGHRLLSRDAESVIIRNLLPLATIVTPNSEEAEILTGERVRTPDDLERAGKKLLILGAAAALMKGGHLEGDILVDVLVTQEIVERISHPRVPTNSTHGTGCTLSAAITAGLALGRSLQQAVREALDFVHRAIETAPSLGAGHGPLNHTVIPAVLTRPGNTR
jgi:hydroxymethylpyrimidine/phosphomethylpyrimidine kinase